MYVECRSSEEKYEAISNIFSIPVGSAMFFCHTKHTANWLAKRLSEDGYQVGLLTGMVVIVLCHFLIFVPVLSYSLIIIPVDIHNDSSSPTMNNMML